MVWLFTFYWICKRDLYDWWKRRIECEAVVGHRYYCLMMLSIYAVKCDISREELEADCLELADVFEGRTKSDDNHFTKMIWNRHTTVDYQCH